MMEMAEKKHQENENMTSSSSSSSLVTKMKRGTDRRLPSRKFVTCVPLTNEEASQDLVAGTDTDTHDHQLGLLQYTMDELNSPLLRTTAMASIPQPQRKPMPMSMPMPMPMLDNTQLYYIPMYLSSCGVTVYSRPDVLLQHPTILDDLAIDVQCCLSLLPPSVHALLRRIPLWLNNSYSYGPVSNPRRVHHSTTHHDKGWLLRIAHDRPEKAPGIEIYDIHFYSQNQWHWNGQGGLLLHEYCHVIHQFCLGLDSKHVIQLWDRARQQPILHNFCWRRDWAGRDVEHDMAYALVNPNECFAELSVAYWSNHNYTNHETTTTTTAQTEIHKTGDINKQGNTTTPNPTCLAEASPPLMAPHVVQRVQLLNPTRTIQYPVADNQYINNKKNKSPNKRESDKTMQPLLRWFGCQSQSDRHYRSSSQEALSTIHCNKFYPFTRQQLQQMDSELFQMVDRLWNQIAEWEDDIACPCCEKGWLGCRRRRCC